MTSPRSAIILRHGWSAIRRAVLCLGAIAAGAGAAIAATLPPGFSEIFIGGLANPTAMAIAPDGRVFVTLQNGTLRVVKNNVLLPAPFLSLTVNSSGERGLLGVALDPAFDSNHFVYVYYTTNTAPIHNRVSRFTANGDVVTGGETILLNLEQLTATNHNGGAIHFGPDGKLYVAVGENAVRANAQLLTNRLGKMLRINKDGSIPTDNPFYSIASNDSRAIWAYGLRNPFTFAFNPGPGQEMFINDVGESSFEEVNVGRAGANYGWSITEGPTRDARFDTPLYSYSHSDPDICAIVGAAFYSPAAFSFPPDYAGDYFFADACAGWIRRMDLATNQVTTFATGIQSPVDIQVAGDGSLYYLARGNSRLYRVRNEPQVQPPPPPPTEPPMAPFVSAFTNGLTLTLSWTPSAGATSYRLEGGSANSLADLVNSDIGSTTTFQALVPPGTYFARLRAVGPAGVSGVSNEVRVTLTGAAACATPPPPPTGYAAQTAGLNVLLGWNPSPSATSYVLEAGSASGLANLLQSNVGLATSLAASAAPGSYFTRVRAANSCGVSAPSSQVTVTLSCNTAPPTGLSATKAGDLVTFRWTGAPGATGYVVQVGSMSGASNLLNANVGLATAVSVSSASVPAGSYFVRVVATTGCGPSDPSNQVVVGIP